MIKKSVIVSITKNEWRAMWRARIPPILFGALMLLLMIASFFSYQEFQHHAATLEKATLKSAQDWQSQPNRHPHRVSHYGDFVAMPIHKLSVVEPGILEQSGHLIYLEAHRLNSANFNPATEATSLNRFPTITPALVIQWFFPLLMLMAGYSTVVRERIEGTLSFMIGNGTQARQIFFAKFLALFLPSLALLGLSAFLLAVLMANQAEAYMRIFTMLIGQTLYIAIWGFVIVGVSWVSKQLHHALLGLLISWVCICIVFPKGLANVAQILYPTQPRVEAEYLAELKLKTIGDSHNPNDPHFATFKAQTLKKYGVDEVEKLPVNFNGLLMQEGERLTSQVYEEQQALHQTQLLKQNGWIRNWLWLSPTLALQYIQMAASGSDLLHHQAFLQSAEQRRMQLISYLNQLHTEKVSNQDDKNQRLEANFWKNAPRPTIALAPLSVSLPSITAAFFVLLGWLLLPCLFYLVIKKI